MTLLEPLGHHELLLLWGQLLVLFLAARGLGLLAQRLGQPSVVGELAAGLLVGPSLFGRIAPGAAQWLFPGDIAHSGMVLAVAWVGVLLLLVETGFETDLGLLRRIGRSTAMVPVGSLLLPLGLGIGMGAVMPRAFVADDRVVFALFMGVCLAVSSLPVVAKILIELRLMRRNVGQVIIVAGMADDIVGWLMLSALAGAAAAGGFQLVPLLTTVGALVLFVALAFTVGQRTTDTLLRRAREHSDGSPTLPLTAVMLVVLVFAVVTQAIGIEAVFGAFTAGIVIARSRWFPRSVEQVIHAVTHGVFAPIFFATAGMYVDLGKLADPVVGLWAVIVLGVASVAKLVGSYLGARMGPLSHREAIAVGVGLNARGALEIIIATIALSVGVFNQSTYTVIVILAMTTSMAAPPLLRWALGNIDASAEEAERLDQEDLMARSVMAKATRALLPTRGGANSAIAARVLGLALRPEAGVTVLTITEAGVDEPLPDVHRERLATGLGDRPVDHRVADGADPAVAVRREAELGYDIVALGLNEDFRGTHRLSPRLRAMITDMPVPILLVRRGHGALGPSPATFERILVPVTGTAHGRAAEEVASTIAGHLDAEVDLLHVVARQDGKESPAATSQLTRARGMAERFGRGTTALVRHGMVTTDEILRAAHELGSDLIVTGATLRRGEDGLPFLGHGTEYLLEHAAQTVVTVVFPESPNLQGTRNG